MSKAVIQVMTFVLLVCASCIRVSASSQYNVTMVLWDGCEAVCTGLNDALNNSPYDIQLQLLNAHGDANNLASIKAQINEERPDAVVTWGTKTTIEIAGRKHDTKGVDNSIPVIFTQVSDPITSDIIDDFSHTGRRNITGVYSRVPEVVNINAIKQYMPNFNVLGVLFEPSAENSLNKVKELKALSEQHGFKLVSVPLDSNAEPMQAIEQGIQTFKQQDVDFIYLGSSTYLEKHGAILIDCALKASLPIITPYENMVHDSHALMSIAANDYEVGKVAALQIDTLFSSDTTAGELPVLRVEDFAYTVNINIAKVLNLYPPMSLLKIIEITPPVEENLSLGDVD
ncbi:ABC transporter substrate-binding protein [Vibrio breoganii]